MKKYIDNILYEKLKNDANIYIKKRPDVESVSIQVWFSVGSSYEDYKEKGIAHFLEQCYLTAPKGMITENWTNS